MRVVSIVKPFVIAVLLSTAFAGTVRAELKCTPTKACNTFEKCGLRGAQLGKPFEIRIRQGKHQISWQGDETFYDIEQLGSKADTQVSDIGAVLRWLDIDQLFAGTLMLQKWSEGYFFTFSMQRGTEYLPVGEIIYGRCKGTLE